MAHAPFPSEARNVPDEVRTRTVTANRNRRFEPKREGEQAITGGSNRNNRRFKPVHKGEPPITGGSNRPGGSRFDYEPPDLGDRYESR